MTQGRVRQGDIPIQGDRRETGEDKGGDKLGSTLDQVDGQPHLYI